MNEPKKQSNLLAELTRRQVFRSAAAYVVIAWVAIQVGSIVLPEFGAPAWAMRALIILLIAGFPPAMLLAWTVDVTLKGISRTPESGYSRTAGPWPRLVMALVATAISGAALWWAWDDYIIRPNESPRREMIKSRPIVAVHPPRLVTGDDELDWLGEGIANLIRSQLAESQYANLVSHSQWVSLTAGADSEEEITAVARKAGVDYLVSGDLFAMPNGITLTMNVDDIEFGRTITSTRISVADSAEIIARVPQISTDIKSVLNIPHTENVGVYEADFASEHIEAYEAYVAGLAYLIDFEYDAAVKAFSSALAIAPDYHVARFRLAQAYEYSGRSRLAREALDKIPADAPVSERLGLYIAGARAYFAEERDMPAAIATYRKLVELYPYESEAAHYLAEAYWLDFQDAASIAEFRRICEIHPFDPVSWMSLGERLLDVGELDEAKVALDRYASMRPDDDFAYALLGNLAMLQGDYETAIVQNRRSLELNPDFVVAIIGLARAHYLNADIVEAIELWQQAIGNEANAPKYRIDATFDLAGVLRGLGRFADSIDLFESMDAVLREEGLRYAMALAERGIAELAVGGVDRADVSMAASLANAPEPRTRYLFARGLMEMSLDRAGAFAQTIADIRSSADTGEDGDWTADNAADYLEGLRQLRSGNIDVSLRLMAETLERPGYRYAVYKLGVAAAYRAAGDLERALELADQAATERDRGDLRLDLELDRARAELLRAEILADQGALTASIEQLRRFRDRWKRADPGLPELERAMALSLRDPAGT